MHPVTCTCLHLGSEALTSHLMALVETTISDRVALVTLNDPERRNVFTHQMNDELIELFDRLEADDGVGAVVITGAGPHFSAGGHLDDLLNSRNQEGLGKIYAGFLRVAHSSLPTVAAVNGAAVGAGMNFALACDLIIAGEGSRFDSRFLQIAIHPGGGHTWRLRNRTDIQTAKAMVLFSQVLNGRRAAEVGLAWECVADDAIVDRAIELASAAAAAPKGLVARAKETIVATSTIDGSAEAVELEVGPQAWSMNEPEFSEFVQKLKDRIAAKK